MEDGLCFIQRNLGETYLPAICETFPRKCFSFGFHLIRTLDISCPVAAKLLFEDEKAMELEEFEETKQIREEMIFELDVNEPLTAAMQPYVFPLWAFILYCMRSPAFFV